MVLVLVFSGDNQPQHTMYPMKFAHGYVVFLFSLDCIKIHCGYIYFFIYILRGCFSGNASETVLRDIGKMAATQQTQNTI